MQVEGTMLSVLCEDEFFLPHLNPALPLFPTRLPSSINEC